MALVSNKAALEDTPKAVWFSVWQHFSFLVSSGTTLKVSEQWYKVLQFAKSTINVYNTPH